jgi:hypothetical protein
MVKLFVNEVRDFAAGFASGEVAVVTSSLINTQVYNRYGLWWMAGVCAPIVEELSKTGFAEISNGNVLVSHVAFGSTEGFMYADESKQIRKFDHRRPLLHAAFGTLYLMGRRLGGSAAGLLTAILGHFAWNQIALIRAKAQGVVFSDDEELDSGGYVLIAFGEPQKAKKAVTYADIKKTILI